MHSWFVSFAKSNFICNNFLNGYDILFIQLNFKSPTAKVVLECLTTKKYNDNINNNKRTWRKLFTFFSNQLFHEFW